MWAVEKTEDENKLYVKMDVHHDGVKGNYKENGFTIELKEDNKFEINDHGLDLEYNLQFTNEDGVIKIVGTKYDKDDRSRFPFHGLVKKMD